MRGIIPKLIDGNEALATYVSIALAARQVRHAARCGQGCGAGRFDHGDCPPVTNVTPSHKALIEHGRQFRSMLQAFLAIRRGKAMSATCDEALRARGRFRPPVGYTPPKPRVYRVAFERFGEPMLILEK